MASGITGMGLSIAQRVSQGDVMLKAGWTVQADLGATEEAGNCVYVWTSPKGKIYQGAPGDPVNLPPVEACKDSMGTQVSGQRVR